MSKYSKELPQDPQSRKNVINNVNEYVDAMLEEQSAKDLQSSIKDTVKEKYGIDPTWLTKVAKIVFDHRYNDNKAGEKIKEDYGILESVEDILK